MSRAPAASLPRQALSTRGRRLERLALPEIISEAGGSVDRLPLTIRILVENAARLFERGQADYADITELARWQPGLLRSREVPFLPTRVVLQDFTGVPAIADLASLRSAAIRAGVPASAVDLKVHADLIIDHAIQVDAFGTADALRVNVAHDYARNEERYAFLRWARHAFRNLTVFPPGSGIIHQVNLELLAQLVHIDATPDGPSLACAETVLGTDSHTPMINALGVLGWGVGGIEAEATLLGEPTHVIGPRVVGVRLSGTMRPGTTATDLALTVTQVLRTHGVVNSFVEYFGEGAARLPAGDRATVANMAPEYGATTGFFPVDEETLRYLKITGRSADHLGLIERFYKEQGIFGPVHDPAAAYDEILELYLDDVEPCVAGPHRPQDRIPLGQVAESFARAYPRRAPQRRAGQGQRVAADGDVLIAAITSCTNTANPGAMLAAGLLARRAVQRGLTVPPWVKTSLAPGSRAVTAYLSRSGLLQYLEELGFSLVAYGCTTCNGMSGPLAADPTDSIGVAVLSGNRNFPGRVHSQIPACYLASPPLVVAYALAGTIDTDLSSHPVGTDKAGSPVFLTDLWPQPEELALAEQAIGPELFGQEYQGILDGDARWHAIPVLGGELFRWQADSTYLREPPFLGDKLQRGDVAGARPLLVLGDGVTTDHISPVGAIPRDSTAGAYLATLGVAPRDFNSYGARRGNHEVMSRGTFGNARLRNEMVSGREGPLTVIQPAGEVASVYEAAGFYRESGTPVIIVAGREYGMGSSRDWAAKGPRMLGVRAILAESFERIHRSNLIGTGVLPLQFCGNENRITLGINGSERFDLPLDQLTPDCRLPLRITRLDGSVTDTEVTALVHGDRELAIYLQGGILQWSLTRLVSSFGKA